MSTFRCVSQEKPGTAALCVHQSCMSSHPGDAYATLLLMAFPPSSVLNPIFLLTEVEQVLHSAALFQQLQYVIPFK